MSREAAECLRIRQNSCAQIALYIALIDTNQCIEQCGIFQNIFVERQLVGLSCAVQNLCKYVRTEGERQNRAADCGRRRISAADVVIHKERGHIICALGERRCLAGDSQHVLGDLQTGILDGVLDECFVGQRLQRGAGLGNNDKQRVCNVYRLEHGCCIVRINVADEFRFHLECVIGLRPVLQCNVKSTGTKVTSADTNLYNCGELLTGFVGDLTSMYLLGKCSNFLLLRYIKFALVYAVCDNCVTLLTACQLMQHEALFAGVDDGAVQQLLVFVNGLGFFCELRKHGENVVIDLLCGIIEVQTCRHRCTIFFNTCSAVFPRHCPCNIHAVLQLNQLAECCERV